MKVYISCYLMQHDNLIIPVTTTAAEASHIIISISTLKFYIKYKAIEGCKLKAQGYCMCYFVCS